METKFSYEVAKTQRKHELNIFLCGHIGPPEFRATTQGCPYRYNIII